MPDIKMSTTKRPDRFFPALITLIFVSALAFGVVSISPLLPAQAADWGYDDVAGGPHGDNSTAHQEGSQKTVKGRPTSGRGRRPASSSKTISGPKGKKTSPLSLHKSKQGDDSAEPPQTNETSLRSDQINAPLKALSPEEVAARKKVDDLKSWMEIYALAASSPTEDDRNQILSLSTLSPDTKKKLEKMLFEKLEQNVPEYLNVSAVWRPLSEKVTSDLDFKDSYRLLFRSLLRHATSRIEPTAPEAELIQEVLGPARIAEMGPPVLTEEAINAYSDMTCFLYQKRHPDHTVEGDDNRQLFAEVIRQRYNDAPNVDAKKAMCKFDLTWAAFRCKYLDASTAEKDKLIASMGDGQSETRPGSTEAKINNAETKLAGSKNIASATRPKTKSGPSLPSPKLLKIFALGPWAESSNTTPLAVKMSQMSEPTK